jgi:hypothetical protein
MLSRFIRFIIDIETTIIILSASDTFIISITIAAAIKAFVDGLLELSGFVAFVSFKFDGCIDGLLIMIVFS